MGDLDRGRLFRVTPKGHKGYKVPKFDFKTDDVFTALKNPNNSVRHIAFTELKKEADDVWHALFKVAGFSQPRQAARDSGRTRRSG